MAAASRYPGEHSCHDIHVSTRWRPRGIVCLEAAPGFPPPVLECLCLFHFTRNSYSANVLLVQCLRYGLWFTSNNQRWLGDEDDPAKRYVALEERTQPQVHVVKDLGVDERALVDHEHRL